MAPTAVECFVDETRRTDYLLVAVFVPVENLVAARRMMRELKPNNRDRLHMKSETRTRDQIIRRFVATPPISQAHIFQGRLRGTTRTEREVRTDCLTALGVYAAAHGVTRILVESCSQDQQDRQALIGALATQGVTDNIRVAVDKPTSHELLWAADLVAWAYGVGGAAREAVAPLVTLHKLI